MTYQAWICEGCGYGQKIRDNVFDCPGCDKEGCDNCFWMYGHCKKCCVGKTEGELHAAAVAKGWDLSPPEHPERIALTKCDGNHAGPKCWDPECWNQ